MQEGIINIDEPLSALEQECERVRKALNAVKFSRRGGQLRRIDNFIDEINHIYDIVT